MKKTLGFIFLLILSFSLFGYSSIVTNLHSNEINLLDNNSTGISVSYEMGRIEGEIITTKDGEYLQLSSEEYSLTGFVGEPQLPYSQKIIAVPLEAKVIINTKIISKEVITLTSLGFDNQIAPAQRSVAKCEDYSKIPFDKDVKIYNSSNYYSHISADVNEIGIFRGLRLFEVNYYPVSYSPSKNEITVINEAEVTVEFVGGNSIATQNLREKTRSRAFEGIYKSYVFNYQNTRSTLEQYPLGYVIVTPTNFLDTLEPFINWKKEQGYDVTILTTTVTGTTTTGIKNHIDNLWDNATPEAPAPSYLLIVGDTPQVPAYVGETGTGEPHVTDLNYVKMEGNDYLPEMYYGRFSATTTSQLANQVNKTLLYQKFEMSDPSYLNRATLIAGVDADYAPTHGNGTIYYGAENYFNSDHGLDVNAYYYPESGTSESSIYADINAGVGYLNYTAHGSQTSWADPSMSITNVNNFTNDEMYPVVVGNCCLTNHFDTPTCFGEAWLRAENGAVIYIGGTNNTLWNEDYWWSVGHFTPTNTAEPTYEDTDLGMFDALFHDNSESFVDWANSAGAMVFRGNMAVQASSSSSKNYYWEIYSIMGDPSLMPRIGVPATQNASYAGSILMGASSLEVTAAPYSYVSLTQDGEIIGTQLLNSSGFGTVSFNALNTPTAVKIVISHTDYRPHISTIAVLPAMVKTIQVLLFFLLIVMLLIFSP
ncbi:MAG: hypothetical protein B6226_02725 [Candidatus Cloacimonetes bacterium 4572_65]|nr:MAG: hypothetical protein B6226_02725 [Candidatus Cloacimonetes bacterium 4572_65]